MTKEEFIKKLESDESLRKAYETNPMKVIQENNVELSEQDLTDISGGCWKPFEPFGPKPGPNKPPWVK